MPAAEVALTKANIVSVYQAGAFFGALGAYGNHTYALLLYTSTN